MKTAAPLITLITDFGLADPYVGQLKGALLKGCPTATLVDLTHAIPTWDVRAAALALHTSYGHFPPGTVHLIVVDPGVGSHRSILAARGDHHLFVCPDNGILTFLLDAGKLETIRRLEQSPSPSHPISPTFHGRDLMAPVAAALAMGRDINTVGTPFLPHLLTRITLPAALPLAGGVQGQVLGIDHFGNIRTSLRAGDGRFDAQGFGMLEINGWRIERWVTVYSEVPVGTLAALTDSCGFVEVAANQARAAALIGCQPGDPVMVRFRHGKPP